jgi:hypothetical protein
MSYDDANTGIAREHKTGNLAGAASASMLQLHYFQKARIKQVRGRVVTAGTNAAAGIDIFNGTTSVGAITFGTNTAGSVGTSGAINSDILADGLLEIKGKANSATLVVTLSIEERVLPEAVNSGGP